MIVFSIQQRYLARVYIVIGLHIVKVITKSVRPIRFKRYLNRFIYLRLICQYYANLVTHRQSAKHCSPTFRFTKCWIYKRERERESCSQKFINGLALAEPTTCSYPNWAVRFFSTSVPVLEYRRLSTVVLARKYCSICQLIQDKTPYKILRNPLPPPTDL